MEFPGFPLYQKILLSMCKDDRICYWIEDFEWIFHKDSETVDVLAFEKCLCRLKKAFIIASTSSILKVNRKVSKLFSWKVSFEESKIQSWNPNIQSVDWSDIGGYSKLKSKLRFYISLLKNDSTRKTLLEKNLAIPSGIILYGSPGTGKTLLVKAMASELGGGFLPITIPDILHHEVGESERRLAEIFSNAKKYEPCIIFIDELDSMFAAREESESYMNTISTRLAFEFSQLRKETRRILVIGATNNLDAIETSLRSPGRFDCCIEVCLPTAMDRELILRKLTESKKTDGIDFSKWANFIKGSPAELSEFIRLASLESIEEDMAEGQLRNTCVLTNGHLENAFCSLLGITDLSI